MTNGQYDVGDLVRLSAAFADTSGSAADPTTVTFKIARRTPGTALVPTVYVFGTDAEVVKDSTGNYHVDWPAAAFGDHVWQVIGTGTVATAQVATFMVRASPF